MRWAPAFVLSCLLLAPSTARAADPLSRTLRESYKQLKMFLVYSGDAKLFTQITSGDRTLYPVEEMIALTNSLSEHYGNVACYMRIKGVTPPSTLRTQRVMQ